MKNKILRTIEEIEFVGIDDFQKDIEQANKVKSNMIMSCEELVGGLMYTTLVKHNNEWKIEDCVINKIAK